MDWHYDIPIPSPNSNNRVILLEASPGEARCLRIQQWLEAAQFEGASTWLLSCDRGLDGPWAGLKDLLNDLVPKIQAEAPELLIKHDYELANVLPSLQRIISVRNPSLTDVSNANERTRNYAADRAFRIIQGLIDLLAAWQQRKPNSSWVIACDRFDRVGGLVHRFFVELVRRRGQYLNLTLLVATDPGAGEAVTSKFNPKDLGACIKLNLPADIATPTNHSEMARLARELTIRVGEDPIELEVNLPHLIYYWLQSDKPEKALAYRIEACSIYTTRGFYEDALVYGETALAQLKRDCPDAPEYWIVCVKLYNCYAALDRPFEALQIVEFGMAKSQGNPDRLFRGCYMISLLYARFLPELDLVKAQEYLEKSLEYLLQAQLPEHMTLFHTAFNQNALALIRHRQGKPNEAAELCQFWYKQLNERLGLNEHRLHRSVLLYNIAQVYTSIGSNEEAIFYLTSAMAMDPNYSEYYNDRGNLYLKLGRLESAENDYLQAIELSPPYWEVWSNLGQCYRLMERMALSVNAYSTSLDLDPSRVSVLLARAQVLETIDQADAALTDYTLALELDANQPLVLANRAILHYDAARYTESVADLNQAIALESENPDLYQNRAVALTALQRFTEAVRDLKTYLTLSPFAEDRLEVESQLLVLQTSGNSH